MSCARARSACGLPPPGLARPPWSRRAALPAANALPVAFGGVVTLSSAGATSCPSADVGLGHRPRCATPQTLRRGRGGECEQRRDDEERYRRCRWPRAGTKTAGLNGATLTPVASVLVSSRA